MRALISALLITPPSIIMSCPPVPQIGKRKELCLRQQKETERFGILKRLAVCLLVSLLTACQSGTATTELPSLPDSLPADFVNFYAKFHADSTYQMEHIQWPLRGFPDQQLAPGEQFAFTPDTWVMQRLIDAQATGYVSSFTALTNDLVVENIINEAEKAQLERRFLRRTDGEWELIYYQGVRPLVN
ncbi:MAG: hypothetical protein AAF828_12875 [Bacteroidota bacterium]